MSTPPISTSSGAKPPAWHLVVPVVAIVGLAGCSNRGGASADTAGSGGADGGHAGNPTGGSTLGGSGGITTGGLGGLGGLGGTNGGGGAGGSGGSAEAGASGTSGGSGTAGAAGDAGIGGAAGAAGAMAMGGAAGASGSTGQAGDAAGSAGTAGTGTCPFEIEGTLSPAIPTVGVVNWSTSLAALSAARIEFSLDDPADDEINRGSGGAIDITGETHRALLLGLKPERSYTYRIIAESSSTVCISADRSLTTGAGPALEHTVTRTAGSVAAPAPGFIVTTDYSSTAYIIDSDGDVVWSWRTGPTSMSRARMDWEGENMWMLQVAGTQGSPGDVRRVSMDGTEVVEEFAGLEDAHHDLAVLPGGVIATLLWTDEASAASDLVERAADGTITTVARLDEDFFLRRSSYHANSIAYHAGDDTLTVGDLDAAGFVKVTRTGELLWQVLAGCPSMPTTKCAAGDTLGNHGHHLLDDGTFLFFKARMTPSIVREYQLTETTTSLTATETWSYDPGGSLGTVTLGDVQRLPNGNTLIVYSNPGEMRELSPAGDVVQTIVVERSFGYADFRETLYGPPLR